MTDGSPAPRSLDRLAIFAAPAVFVLLWASGFIGAKYGMPFAEPLTFLFYRMLAVVVLIGLIVLATRPPWPDRSGLLHSAITGLFVHGCYLGGVFVALDHKLPAGLVALVVSLQPVLTSTLANRLLGERVLPRQWLGLGLGIVGVYFVVQGRTAGEGSLVAWAAATFALVGMTIGTLYQRRHGGAIDWRTGFLVQYAAAAGAFGLGALAFETRVVRWTPEFLFALAWLVFALSFGAIWLLYFLIRRQAAARVVSLFYLTPPFTSLMAWAMFGEKLALPALVGMAICVVGVALVNWRVGAGAPQSLNPASSSSRSVSG
ncbi:MAG TPA: DMT family transporter [Xanthobacteraceae bacterium]|nr:DMT family transporter [Xanthobacteraceae bacterium]